MATAIPIIPLSAGRRECRARHVDRRPCDVSSASTSPRKLRSGPFGGVGREEIVLANDERATRMCVVSFLFSFFSNFLAVSDAPRRAEEICVHDPSYRRRIFLPRREKIGGRTLRLCIRRYVIARLFFFFTD